MGLFGKRREQVPPVILPPHAIDALNALLGRDQGFARVSLEALVREIGDAEVTVSCAVNYAPWTSIPSLWVVTDKRLHEIRKDYPIRSVALAQITGISSGRSDIDYRLLLDVPGSATEKWTSHLNEQLHFASDETEDAKRLHAGLRTALGNAAAARPDHRELARDKVERPGAGESWAAALVADSTEGAREQAALLHRESNRLAGLRRPEEALTQIDQAVSLLRELLAAHPGSPEERLAELATALSDQSNRLAELGHGEYAVRKIDEAVAICRGLAVLRPEKFSRVLANALINQSAHHASQDELGEALRVITESVELLRGLVQGEPDALPELAMALNNQSNRLFALDGSEEAMY